MFVGSSARADKNTHIGIDDGIRGVWWSWMSWWVTRVDVFFAVNFFVVDFDWTSTQNIQPRFSWPLMM